MAKKKSGNSLLKQISSELKKVKWPDKKEMTKYTTAVILFIILFALYFFGLEALFSWFKGIIG